MADEKRKRRERGEGSISERKDGTWTGRVVVGYGKDGKQKVKAVYGKTEREVKARLKELIPDIRGHDLTARALTAEPTRKSSSTYLPAR